MGYFSNGTEGDDYEARYCCKCLNYDDEMGCPILNLHLLWNYDAVGPSVDPNERDAKAYALNHFIPRKGIENLQCRMFKPSDRDRLKAWNEGRPMKAEVTK